MHRAARRNPWIADTQIIAILTRNVGLFVSTTVLILVGMVTRCRRTSAPGYIFIAIRDPYDLGALANKSAHRHSTLRLCILHPDLESPTMELLHDCAGRHSIH
jgi:hypothetical protein